MKIFMDYWKCKQKTSQFFVIKPVISDKTASICNDNIRSCQLSNMKTRQGKCFDDAEYTDGVCIGDIVGYRGFTSTTIELNCSLGSDSS